MSSRTGYAAVLKTVGLDQPRSRYYWGKEVVVGLGDFGESVQVAGQPQCRPTG